MDFNFGIILFVVRNAVLLLTEALESFEYSSKRVFFGA